MDGASDDGTVAYVAGLKARGLIDQFLSEPDCGEAHALNKGILLSRGALIKVITDDNVYHYPGIERCKAFMLGCTSVQRPRHGGRLHGDVGGR